MRCRSAGTRVTVTGEDGRKCCGEGGGGTIGSEALQAVYFHNTVGAWLLGVMMAVLTVTALSIAKGLFLLRSAAFAERHRNGVVELVVLLVRRTWSFFLLAIGISAGLLAVTLPAGVAHSLSAALGVVMLAQVGLWGSEVISFAIDRHVARRAIQDAVGLTTVGALRVMGKLLLLTLILLLALDNLGIRVNALIAGLGIGGIAVGLAAQSILADLFASFAIVLDKPFLLGDFIVVNQYQGTVEHIGLKTTRIRSMTGEEIIFSNADLLKSQIRNLKRMQERRVTFSLAITYDTSSDKVASIPLILKEIVTQQPALRFLRAHFKSFGDSALLFEVVYYVLNADYLSYMDAQQSINLAIHRRFSEEHIEFAYPTQTVYLAGTALRMPSSGVEVRAPADAPDDENVESGARPLRYAERDRG